MATAREQLIGAFMGVSIALGGAGTAMANDGVKVSDLMAQDPIKRALYVSDKASDRIVYLGRTYGGKALECLSPLFTRMTSNNGEAGLAPGHAETLGFLRFAYTNGYANASAVDAINLAVDKIAINTCGVSREQAKAPIPGGTG